MLSSARHSHESRTYLQAFPRSCPWRLETPPERWVGWLWRSTLSHTKLGAYDAEKRGGRKVTKQMTTQMPRWAESLMRKHGISEPPPAGVVPDWLQREVEKTPLWYTIREAKEVRRAHPYLLVEEL